MNSQQLSTGTPSITVPTSVPAPKSDKTLRSRSCCFTYHDYHLDGAEQRFMRYAQECSRYMVLGFEVCPETGRQHIQGYVAWENPRSLNKFQTDIGLKRFHFEITRGTPLQASEYCKKDGKFWEYGTLPQQGERTDWQKAINDLDNGLDIRTVVSEQPQLLPAIRSLEKYKNLTMKSTHRDVNVIFIFGSPGTGKTRFAWDYDPELYTKPEGQWWDGYTDQKTILLDDYQGDINYTQFLKVLDRYPINLPIKGGFVPANYTTVIITSNKNFNQWYNEPPQAIARRIRTVINMDIELQNGQDYQTIYQEARRKEGWKENETNIS